MERKRRGWLERIKRLFVSEPKQKPKPDKVCTDSFLPQILPKFLREFV
jgi:hypothetical protein